MYVKGNKAFSTCTVVIAVAVWLLGDVMEHVYQMVVAENRALGNAMNVVLADVAATLVIIIVHLRNR